MKIREVFFILIVLTVIFLTSSFGHTAGAIQGLDQTSEIVQSFSRYFSPQVFRRADALMKERFGAQPDGVSLWSIWKTGFYRNFRSQDVKFEIIMNRDGFLYVRKYSGFSAEIIYKEDWTIWPK